MTTTETTSQLPQWQPIEHDQLRVGMRIRVTVQCDDRATTHIGVAHYQGGSRFWLTEGRWALTGWGDYPITYEVDLSTVPADPDADPDADLIEKIGETLYRTHWPSDMWDGLSVEAYRKLARAALAAIRAEEAGEQA